MLIPHSPHRPIVARLPIVVAEGGLSCPFAGIQSSLEDFQAGHVSPGCLTPFLRGSGNCHSPSTCRAASPCVTFALLVTSSWLVPFLSPPYVAWILTESSLLGLTGRARKALEGSLEKSSATVCKHFGLEQRDFFDKEMGTEPLQEYVCVPVCAHTHACVYAHVHTNTRNR